MQKWSGRFRRPVAASVQWGRTHPWLAAAIGVGVIAVVVTAWLFRPATEPADGPRARVYRDVDVCLLTDARGVAVGEGSQAWQGLQDFSNRTAVRVSYVPVIGPATSKNAGQFLAGLVQRRCRVVVAVGKAEVEAVEASASRSLDVGFVVVGSIHRDQANIVVVNAADPRLGEQVSAAIGRLAKL